MMSIKEQLKYLARGCKEHPAYRAKNYPRAKNCQICLQLYGIAVRLKVWEKK